PCEGAMTGVPEIVRRLGFDSVTSYVWVHHAKLAPPTTDYGALEEAYFAHWERMLRDYDIPYYPNVTVGWDPSPRTLPSDVWTPGLRYPYTPVVTGNTPERFGAALRRCADQARELGVATLNLNSWNEWTEGSMLEPEAEYGMAYLEAVRAVFGSRRDRKVL
ncbi:MAG: glycoside hydrolase family 99-like domain-containing protein, partial [Lentisphaeria bacterium]|nr:glycoside hydrolase family 99-like domain-containing protein [Lentisphaeria bacterium]